ncbi:MAG: AMP-binding protein [Roseiflexus sp.]|nr:AMP-binding protein [Roseiflexus sp.]MCS7289786.1 AMP-binding protein [Roseiflexus sp.]MDW8145731.1 AMP-binding protein [Roseiflexaceae bacterium]MDW8232499.1 AMP-binding protein [Roseiflexaceae bacterium]
MLVHDFLTNSAARLPDKVALVCDGRRLTYRDLDQMTNRLAHALVERGVRRGDRVAIFAPNSVEAVVGIFAALKAGGVFVVINHTTKQDKLTSILNNCRASAIIADAQIRDVQLSALLQNAPSLQVGVLCNQRAETRLAHPRFIDFDEVQTQYDATPLPRVNIDLDLACLIYTSGSTGEPKGVMSDHSNVVFVSGSIIEYLHNVEDDVVINMLPLSFDYGLYQLLMTVRFGGRLVLERSFAYPAAILKRVEEERVTGFPGVPTIYAMLLQMDLSQYDLSSIRYMTNTAAALPPSHVLELRRKFPWVRIYSMYGLTETKRTLYLPPEELDRRPGSVGIAIPGTEVWLEDEQGNRLGPGEVGELVVRGRHVMRGYWEAPEATAQRYRPGPLPGERVCYTGDLFRMDEDGYLYFVGRKDDIIKSRGEKVAPKEVENVIYELPGVAAVAVVGVPDPILGQAIKAFVVTKNPDLTEKQILAHCRARLEDFMVPQYVEFRDELPVNTSGKIARRELAGKTDG